MMSESMMVSDQLSNNKKNPIKNSRVHATTVRINAQGINNSAEKSIETTLKQCLKLNGCKQRKPS